MRATGTALGSNSGPAEPEAELGPASAGLMPCSASKALMLTEWAAGPGAVLYVTGGGFRRA